MKIKVKPMTEQKWYKKLLNLFSRRQSSGSLVSESTTIVDDVDMELSSSKFAKLTGIKILARTDTEDDQIRNISETSVSDTLVSEASYDHGAMDEAFFSPPCFVEYRNIQNIPQIGNRSMPNLKKTSQIQSSHHRSRSDGGACFIVPVGQTNEMVLGRFTLKREEVQSSYWKPRRISGPSRFREDN